MTTGPYAAAKRFIEEAPDDDFRQPGELRDLVMADHFHKATPGAILDEVSEAYEAMAGKLTDYSRGESDMPDGLEREDRDRFLVGDYPAIAGLAAKRLFINGVRRGNFAPYLGMVTAVRDPNLSRRFLGIVQRASRPAVKVGILVPGLEASVEIDDPAFRRLTDPADENIERLEEVRSALRSHVVHEALARLNSPVPIGMFEAIRARHIVRIPHGRVARWAIQNSVVEPMQEIARLPSLVEQILQGDAPSTLNFSAEKLEAAPGVVNGGDFGVDPV